MSDNPALQQFIQSIPLFKLVQPKELMDILRLLRPTTLEAGQVVFKEGGRGDAMWVLGNGAEVSLSTTPQAGGRPVVVAYAKVGDTIGEMALVDEAPRSATAVVMQGGPAHQIDAIDFQTLRDGYNHAAFKVLRKICIDLCTKLRATSDRIAAPGAEVLQAPALVATPLSSAAQIDEFPPFRNLPQVVKLALSQKLKLVETDGVAPVFGEGEHGDAAYFVLDGEVTVGRTGKALTTLGPGAMFGLVAVIDSGKRSANCITAGPARLLRLDDSEFDSLFAAGNKFAFQLVDLVARQLVDHVRTANSLLPQPGQGAVRTGRAISGPKVPPASGSQEDSLPEAEVLPMELELEL